MVSRRMSIVAVDTGGTFTDVVYERDGALHMRKVVSTPDDPARAVIAAVASLDAMALTHGSTVATNALLERRGARVALITNAGFEDVIEIGRQNRPQLYALSGARPAPLVERALRFGVMGRLDQHGVEIEALDEARVTALHDALQNCDAIAVCLLHSYANDAHERRIGELLRAIEKHLSLSCELLPEYREYERTATTVVNAYVAPLMDNYLANLEAHSGAQRVRIMGSGGGTVSIARARREPVHTVLSGPAGGVAGALAAARAEHLHNIISFDMGGTSTDVSLCPGRALHTREFSIAGTPIAIPVLDIHTVGAGGGSMAWLDAAGALHVGPRSAGAQPGPICYGRGGTSVTVTDANVWLGRLPVDAFLGGEETLSRDAIAAPLSQLADALGMSGEETAQGIIAIANSTMEGALRVISVERGFDPIDFTLVAFGGAAGLHAVELAERLGVPRILLPRHPGVLSGYGMLASPVRKSVARTMLLRSSEPWHEPMQRTFEELEARIRADMSAEDVADDEVETARIVEARYFGQSYELRVDAADWIAEFHQAHRARYGYARIDAELEAVTLRVDATSARPQLPAFAEDRAAREPGVASVFIDGWRDVPVIARAHVMKPLAGPAVITEYSATTWLPQGWRARPGEAGGLLLEHA